MAKLLDTEIDDIINLYQAGETPKNIGIKYGIFANSVNRIIKRKGIANNQLIRVSKENIDKIIKDYQLGISTEKIAKQLNIDPQTACRILERNKIPLRSPSERTRTYIINEHYFDVIDTQNKAYFLGLLYADGCVSKKGYSTVLSLHKKDEGLVKQLSILIYNEEHVNYHEDSCCLEIYSKYMNETLTKHGCEPLKTFTIRFPTWLDDNLIPHFIRGYLDGDGCISAEDRFAINFTSNAMFIRDLHDILESKFNITSNIYSIGPNKNVLTKQLLINSNANKLNFLNLIYKDANIYMERKYQKYQYILNNLEKIAPRLYKEIN